MRSATKPVCTPVPCTNNHTRPPIATLPAEAPPVLAESVIVTVSDAVKLVLIAEMTAVSVIVTVSEADAAKTPGVEPATARRSLCHGLRLARAALGLRRNPAMP